MKHNVAGKWAENTAAHFLQSKGYKILVRNFNTRFGEIDIVASENVAGLSNPGDAEKSASRHLRDRRGFPVSA